MVIDQDYNIYHLPCGDMCASTCLDQSDQQPTYEVLLAIAMLALILARAT